MFIEFVKLKKCGRDNRRGRKGRGVTEGDGGERRGAARPGEEDEGGVRRGIDQSGQACREISSCSGIKAGLADTEDSSRMQNRGGTTSEWRWIRMESFVRLEPQQRRIMKFYEDVCFILLSQKKKK